MIDQGIRQPWPPFDELRNNGPLFRFRHPDGVTGWYTGDAGHVVIRDEQGQSFA